MSDVLALAAEIRRVDGRHDKGAAALAEALEPFMDAVVAAAKADERRRVLDDVGSFMDESATGWQNLRDYIRATREAASKLKLERFNELYRDARIDRPEPQQGRVQVEFPPTRQGEDD